MASTAPIPGFPFQTATNYAPPLPTTFATSVSIPVFNNEQETSSSTTSTRPSYTSTSFPSTSYSPDTPHFWDYWHGSQIAIVAVIIICVLAIVLLSMWCCCGCFRGGRHCGKRRQLPTGEQNRDVPLGTIPPERRGRADAREVHDDPPPPMYAETAPPQHQTIAGGITHIREEDEGVISDGKTPLSEIPFEDVVLDHHESGGSGSGSGSPSSAREFTMRHHGLGGDTRGHTNS